MARNPDNVNIWQDARVWMALATGARPDLPTDAATAVNETDWLEGGILDGDAGFGEERTNDETKHYGWGLGLIKIGNKNFELSRTFSFLEDNDATRGILWPGSTRTALYMPKPVDRYLGFETVSDTGKVERLWTTRPARLTIPNNNRNETDITKLEVTASIFSDGNGKLFDRQATLEGIPDTVITISGSPTGGTFTLTVEGQTTTGIAYNATASAVQAALVALSTVGAGNATVTGVAGGPYTVQFADTVEGTFTADGSGLTPSGTVVLTNP